MMGTLRRVLPRARRRGVGLLAATLLLGVVLLPADALAARPPAPSPYNDPNLVSMFNGTSLTGWTSGGTHGPDPGLWTATGGVIHGNGTGRGWLYYNTQVQTFRWIFGIRHLPVTAGKPHAPTTLIWGSAAPACPKTVPNPCDALQGIQFQPPNGGHWDYRIGHNTGGGAEFKPVAHTAINAAGWSQCELIANGATGVARMACCPLGTAATCKGVEVLDFHDATAARMGLVSLQVHNAGLHDEYRNLWIDSHPTNPNHFVTS